MRGRTVIFVSLLALASGCKPETCEPKPMPAEFSSVAVPPSAVVCGMNGRTLELNYKVSTKQAVTDTVSALSGAGWSVEGSKAEDRLGSVDASKNGTRIHVKILAPQRSKRVKGLVSLR